MVIRGAHDIRDAYRDDTVAERYVAERFRAPLGALLHRRQVAALVDLLRTSSVEYVLEIAPGPARLTLDVARAWTGSGVSIDSSRQMLSQAVARLAADGARHWRLVQGDAFNLPFAQRFDLVYSFRLIRHFELEDRTRLYAQVARVLRPGGLFVFDAVNKTVSAPLRAKQPEEYTHYDALLTPETLGAELTAAGFRLTSLRGVQHRYPLLQRVQTLVAPRSAMMAHGLMEVVDRLGGEPLEWIVTARRIG